MKKIAKAASLTAASCALLAGGAGVASAHDGADAQAAAVGSPGVISGNAIQIPVHVPINLCGNSIDIIGLLNPANGNGCASGVGHDRDHHGDHHDDRDHHGEHDFR